ncbi:MAG: HAMP domain-containing histidine kinase [Balneolaceae bacterium]|nr:HAMP domain-containing histidine kinase [Balneolaceae bacterium]MCH8548677.1 HAMP domain-containing histidine kinase [Balneolaceae bacterium]
MQRLLPSNRIKIILVVLLVLLAGASFVYNQFLLNRIMAQERASIELWAKAFEFINQPIHDQRSRNLITVANELQGYNEVPDSLSRMILEAESAESQTNFVFNEIIQPDLFQIPVVLVDASGFIVHYRNIHDDEDIDQMQLVERYGAYNEPIPIRFGEEPNMQTQSAYYGESPTLSYLRYFPYVQFGILALLIGVGYTTYRSITRSEQSNLWVGMAKEAAHQLGTPLSSMYGWLQLLKDRNQNDEEMLTIVYEVENDVTRLKGIAERFNKIGSMPELKRISLEPIIDDVLAYMERRLPQVGKHVEIRKSIQTKAKIELNPELFQWAIENLIKNAMDAMKGTRGDAYVAVTVTQDENQIRIDVEDSGSGIDRKNLNEIFKPGYSTKKRGWGLGLSLTKRIIEEYHKGKIFVLRSEVNKGTTIRILLPA